MADVPELLYTGAGRTVVALDRLTGRPVWRRKLPRLFGGLLTLAVYGDEVYIGRGGYIYCLDRWKGDVLWERGITATGATVLMALPGMDAAGAAAAEESTSAGAGPTP